MKEVSGTSMNMQTRSRALQLIPWDCRGTFFIVQEYATHTTLTDVATENFTTYEQHVAKAEKSLRKYRFGGASRTTMVSSLIGLSVGYFVRLGGELDTPTFAVMEKTRIVSTHKKQRCFPEGEVAGCSVNQTLQYGLCALNIECVRQRNHPIAGQQSYRFISFQDRLAIIMQETGVVSFSGRIFWKQS